MSRLFPKLTLAFLAVALTAVLVVGFSASSALERAFERYASQGTSSQRLAAAGTALAEYYQQNGTWEGINSVVVETADRVEGRLVLADADGVILADSLGRLEGRRVAPPALALATPIVRGSQVVGYVYFQADDRRPEVGPLAALSRLVGRGGGAGHPMADMHGGSMPMAGPNPAGMGPAESGFLVVLSDSLWVAALLAAGVAVALSLLLARQITSPLRRLTQAAQGVAQGNLAQKVEVSAKDEIGDLASAFNAMAEQLQRNELARRHMVADVAHELNTPLSVIRGNLEAMLDGVVPLEPEQVASLYEESMLLSRLISDLRDLSLAEAGQLHLQLAPEDVGGLVRRAVERLQPQAQAKGVSLKVEPADGLPPVEADADRIVQVIGNLLHNALRHTPAGGSVTLSAHSTPPTGVSAQSLVEVTVSDTGSGIPSDSLPHVFDRFYRADPSRARATGGSGLGLAIVQQLVQAHGGKVWAESREGQGAIFHFTLPAVAGAPRLAGPGRPILQNR